MQGFKNVISAKNALLLFLSLAVFTVSCKKEVVEEVIYDNIIYQIDTVPVYQSNTEKDRLKTPIQYISSLYSNLAFSSIPTSILDNLVVYRLSIGDKTLVNELILNAMLEDPAITALFPTNAEMRDDIDAFIDESYLRFYLRNPTAYEKYSLHNIIEADEDITVTDMFRAFLLSNEYMFY